MTLLEGVGGALKKVNMPVVSPCPPFMASTVLLPDVVVDVAEEKRVDSGKLSPKPRLVPENINGGWEVGGAGAPNGLLVEFVGCVDDMDEDDENVSAPPSVVFVVAVLWLELNNDDNDDDTGGGKWVVLLLVNVELFEL